MEYLAQGVLDMDEAIEITLRPSAAKLLESMRDIGYSFKSALADIVDNCVAAGAKQICIVNNVDAGGSPYIAITDDGVGMLPDDLTAAMQHGARSPRERREEGDLGRFGLGMKTASLSQCRRLTVVSRRDGMTSARSWDLDTVLARDEWILLSLSSSQIGELPEVDRLPARGTLVLWQGLDRLNELTPAEDVVHEALNRLFAVARPHLALTFHRFLRPEAPSKVGRIAMTVNGSALDAPDPFARDMTPQSDSHELERLDVPGGSVEVQAFTLPHHQGLTPVQLESLALGSSMSEAQGLYIYRANRLICGGTWLGLAKKSELTKLLRVRIDVPTALDFEWGVDVRKSHVNLPASVRQRLRPLVERMTEKAVRPYVHRGHKQAKTGGLPLWVRVTERGAIRYEINRDHPIVARVAALGSSAKFEVDSLIASIESTIPLESMFSDVGATPQQMRQAPSTDEDLLLLLSAFVDAVSPASSTLSRSDAEKIARTHPFSSDSRVMQLLEKIRPIVS